VCLALGGLCLALGASCYGQRREGPPAPARVTQAPKLAREVRGSIVGLDGQPLENVRISASGFHAGQTTPETTTDAAGTFRLTGLLDANALLRVEAPGFYDEVIPVYLEGTNELLELEPLGLVAKQPDRVRLWLAGDTMFGRRFEDGDEDGEVGEDSDLIHPTTRAEDAYRLLHFLAPALTSADFRMSNFESPASTAEESRHPFKHYSFSSHPDTIAALKRVGIDAVSLGNNHSYDYLEAGRVETEQVLDGHGISWFGSGASELEARGSFLDVQVNGVPLSFQGMNGIKPGTFYPEPHEPWPLELMYYAMDTPRKGGSLLLSQDNLAEFMRFSPERLRIPVLHGGEEYGDTPSPTMRDRFEQAFSAGAKLVVAHHSHTPYGVALWGDADDPGVSLLSLGNFLFDQDVFETFNSVMSVVDIDRTSDGSYHLLQVRLIPFHQENYVPSLISGWQAERLARHIGQISTFLPERPEDELRPAVVFADAAGLGVMVRPGDYTETEHTRTRTLSMEAGRSSAFALNDAGGASDYFLSYADAPPNARLRLGEDLLIYGDFEDYDLDDQIAENDNWWQTDTRYPTPDRARSGRYSIALYRALGSTAPVNTQLRNRLTFEPGAELSFGCHVLGEQAGAVLVTVEYIERNTRNKIVEDKLMSWPAGSYDWTEHQAALFPPAAAGHVRFVITMQPSSTGGTMYIDDCKLYSWGPSLAVGEAIPTPHGFDWGRLEVPDYAGDVSFSEQHRTYRRQYGPR
jgi:poly-gamma-glutamate capsule biosynthesis protein CapA/YwtB (metallophosphatase superfamily)